jgi:HlyD family secretion protein
MNDKTQDRNRGKALRRWIGWGLVLVAAAALVFAVYRPRPLVIEVASVAKGSFEQVIEEDGQFRLKNRYTIAAPTPADLLRPSLKVGDLVKAGDVVATLAPAAPQMIDARTRIVLEQRVGSAEAARRAAAAQVQRAQTALEQATLEARRADQLAKDRFIAPSARDQATLARQAAQEALTAARAQQGVADFSLSEARAALSRSQPASGTAPTAGLWLLKSPVSGQVLKLYKDSASPVVAGQPLLDIGDTAAMEAVIDVLSGEVQQIQPGAVVQLSTSSNTPPIAGRVARIEPVAFTKISALGIEEQRVNVIVELASATEDAKRLGDGFRVDARITIFSQADVLLVPTAALVRDGERWQVFVVERNRAVARTVEIQQRNADVAWVREGLGEGDTVLLYPGSIITDGQAVKVRAGS